MHGKTLRPWHVYDDKGKHAWNGTNTYTIKCTALHGDFKKYNGLTCTLTCAYDDAFDMPMTMMGLWQLIATESVVPVSLGLAESLVFDALLPMGLVIEIWTERGRVFRFRKGVLNCLRLNV